MFGVGAAPAIVPAVGLDSVSVGLAGSELNVRRLENGGLEPPIV